MLVEEMKSQRKVETELCAEDKKNCKSRNSIRRWVDRREIEAGSED
jgi:hypothetical protein